MNRVEFETHAISVRPEAMTRDAIQSELSNLAVCLERLIDAEHGPLSWRERLPLIGAGALLVGGLAGLVVPPIGIAALLGSGGLLVHDAKKHMDRSTDNLRLLAAKKRIKRRREDIEAEIDRRKTAKGKTP